MYLMWSAHVALLVETGICVLGGSCTAPPTTAALQDIAMSEAELTKRRVQVSAGGKQADKMTRDAAKTQSDLDKASADMQAKQQDFKVRAVVSSRSPGLACVTRSGTLNTCLRTSSYYCMCATTCLIAAIA